MRVYDVPAAVRWIETDYRNYDAQREQAREAQHMADLKAHLIEYGHRGKYTGKIVRFGVADGYALYMLADGRGRYGNSFLIHLPYGDAYHYRGIEHFPKREIVREIERYEALQAIFSQTSTED